MYQVACGAEQLVYVNAIPTRVGFGNMQGRFAPEQIAANTEAAIAVAAREAELELLTLMYGASKQVKPDAVPRRHRVTSSPTVDLLIAQYRYSHRIPRTARFTAVFSDWAKDLIRADICERLRTTTPASRTSWRSATRRWTTGSRVRKVNVIWTIDALEGRDLRHRWPGDHRPVLPDHHGGQRELLWPGQSADAAFRAGVVALPRRARFQFLDGGGLDLGVVRDSTLDATNDYETFVEIFESVAMRGLEVYQVQSVVLPNGGSAGTVAVTGYEE